MATETFTLTLDDTPSESVSVTINDTSTNPFSLVGYVTGISTYDYRSFDVYADLLMLWRRRTSGNSLDVYPIQASTQGVSTDADGGRSSISSVTPTTAGMDLQGWSQIVAYPGIVGLAFPLATQGSNVNQGNLVVYPFNTTTGTLGSPTNAGALAAGANSFNWYKVAGTKNLSEIDYICQAGYAGTVGYWRYDVSIGSPLGSPYGGVTTSSTTRLTRGLSTYSHTTHTAYVYGKTPNASNSVEMSIAWRRHSDNAGGVYNWNATGNNQEVARYTSVVAVSEYVWLVAMTGDGAGTRVYRLDCTSSYTNPTRTLIFNSSVDSDGSLTMYRLDNTTTNTPYTVLLLAGRVWWAKGDASNMSFTESTTSLLDVIPGITETRGVVRVGGKTGTNGSVTTIVLGTNSGRIHIIDPSSFNDWVILQ